MDDKTLFDLVNAPIAITFAGKEYFIRKANLEKGVLYQTRLKDLVTANDPALDIKIAAYCLYLVLNDIDKDVTEEYILKNAPATFNPLEWIEVLGFMTPQKKLEQSKPTTA